MRNRKGRQATAETNEVSPAWHTKQQQQQEPPQRPPNVGSPPTLAPLPQTPPAPCCAGPCPPPLAASQPPSATAQGRVQRQVYKGQNRVQATGMGAVPARCCSSNSTTWEGRGEHECQRGHGAPTKRVGCMPARPRQSRPTHPPHPPAWQCPRGRCQAATAWGGHACAGSES